MKFYIIGALLFGAVSANAGERTTVDCNKVALIDHAHKKTKFRVEDYKEREARGLITSTDDRLQALRSLATPLNRQMFVLSSLIGTEKYLSQIDHATQALKSKSNDEHTASYLGALIVDHLDNYKVLIAQSGCKPHQLKMCLFDKDSGEMIARGGMPLINFRDLKRLKAEKKAVLMPCLTHGSTAPTE